MPARAARIPPHAARPSSDGRARPGCEASSSCRRRWAQERRVELARLGAEVDPAQYGLKPPKFLTSRRTSIMG